MGAELAWELPGRLRATGRARELAREFGEVCPALGEALRLLAAETRTEHLAGAQWSTRRYMTALGVRL